MKSSPVPISSYFYVQSGCVISHPSKISMLLYTICDPVRVYVYVWVFLVSIIEINSNKQAIF